jgi:peptidoglycan/xylan/chitin deacetylase (PgdA/CDA1 family)
MITVYWENGFIFKPMKRKILMASFLALAVYCSLSGQILPEPNFYLYHEGAIIRGDTAKKNLALVFTGDEFADGGSQILTVLENQRIHGSFFLTGNFYRNEEFRTLIKQLSSAGHYLGAHSDQHLLYCDWEKRDSLLVSSSEFRVDLENNYKAMSVFGIIKRKHPIFFLPTNGITIQLPPGPDSWSYS